MKFYISFFILLFSTQLLAAKYISSVYNGLQLTNENGMARTAKWSPENALEFSDSGILKMKGLCLQSKGMGYASWRPCNDGFIGQLWSIEGDLLKNKEGFCAEVESYPNTVLNARMILKVCRAGKVEQKWRTHD